MWQEAQAPQCESAGFDKSKTLSPFRVLTAWKAWTLSILGSSFSTSENFPYCGSKHKGQNSCNKWNGRPFFLPISNQISAKIKKSWFQQKKRLAETGARNGWHKQFQKKSFQHVCWFSSWCAFAQARQEGFWNGDAFAWILWQLLQKSFYWQLGNLYQIVGFTWGLHFFQWCTAAHVGVTW